jgi:hypothetical protein
MSDKVEHNAVQAIVTQAIAKACHREKVDVSTKLADKDGLNLNTDQDVNLLCIAVQSALEGSGYKLRSLRLSTLAAAKTVGEIVDLVCKDLEGGS